MSRKTVEAITNRTAMNKVINKIAKTKTVKRKLVAETIPAALGLVFIAMMIALPMTFSQKQTLAQPTEDLPPGAMQAKATTACLECHEARIILQQRLSKAAWTKEVDKMVKWGAVVDAGDRDALIDYLSTNFSPDQPPYQPPRSSHENSGSRNSK
jgi:hypothetical protein